MTNPTIFIITYNHKHGTDTSAFRTEDGARRAAAHLVYERSQEDDLWSEEAVAKLAGLDDKDYVGVLALFEDVENGFYNGESIEINQAVLGD